MLAVIVSLVILGCFLYYSTPKEGIGYCFTLLWSEWAKRLSIFQVIVTVGVVSLPTTFNPYFWRDIPSLIDFLFNPFNNLPTADPVSQVYLISCIIIPLVYGLWVHRELVVPLCQDRSPDGGTFDQIFSAGLLLVAFILVVAGAMAYMYGMHILYLVTPIFAGLFIGSVYLTRLARVHYVPRIATKARNRILFAICGVALLASGLLVVASYVIYGGQLALAGYEPMMLASGALLRAVWMICLLGAPIIFLLVLDRIVRSLRKPRNQLARYQNL